MPLTASMLSPLRVVAEDGRATVAHAAEELRAHLGRIPGNEGATGEVRIRAGSGAGDGFRISAADGGVVVAGDNPRGALNGAYWLLDRLGFAWVEPGDGGVAFVPGESLDDGEQVESPAFRRRTLILGQDALHDGWRGWMEWASRNRYNDVFFHDTPPSVWDRGGAKRPETARELDVDGSGWLFERWDAEGDAIASEAAVRGMTLQFGGHHLPTLVPREEFEHHPEWFPLRKGSRDPRYNICTATPALRRFLAGRVEEFLARFPGAGTYHFWADDIRGGGWCECRDGCGSSPSDQALLATNLIAETVERVLPGARVAHLAYHDTVEPPESVRPRDNVTLLWAPRERCYAHAIDDDSCGRNRDQYWRPFRGLLDLFAAHDRVQVFEYYSDAVLFKGLAPAHLRILPRDAAAYRDAGVANLQDLMVGDRPWVGPPWHAWWFSRCAWRPAAEAGGELSRFCAAAFGERSAGDAADSYREAEAAYAELLDLHDLQRRPRYDVLDFSDEPRATLSLKATEARHAAGALLLLQGRWQAGEGRAGAERIQAEFVGDVARHLAHRLTAWDAALDGRREDALHELDLAEAALRDITAWDARNNAPAYANLSGRMRRSMSFHCMEVRRVLDP